ncbi:unnamed protein product [Periconia digitata]|uniref:Uncharacterized protein n=1 Tax=Periconia digitata TaxID=1303443 RepID=A0A9W4XUV7_9PLEO|nr:unnamed protein product [Periconia digitata]
MADLGILGSSTPNTRRTCCFHDPVHETSNSSVFVPSIRSIRSSLTSLSLQFTTPSNLSVRLSSGPSSIPVVHPIFRWYIQLPSGPSSIPVIGPVSSIVVDISHSTSSSEVVSTHHPISNGHLQEHNAQYSKS